VRALNEKIEGFLKKMFEGPYRYEYGIDVRQYNPPPIFAL